MQEQEDMENARNMGLTTRKPERTFEEMVNAIRDSLSDLASSDLQEDVEDERDDDQDTEQGKLNKDDVPGWVMGTISETAQHLMVRFQQKQMMLEKVPQQKWGDAAIYFNERDRKYEMAELTVPAGVKLQEGNVAAAPALTTLGELRETLCIVPRIWQML